MIPDLDARVTLMDEKNNVIAHLGDCGRSEGRQSTAHEDARHVQTRQIHLPARRML